MFNIDLLKGEGLPEKGKARNMLVVAIASAVPVIAAIVMFGFYLHEKIEISILSRQVVQEQKNIEELSDAVAKLQKLEKEKADYGIRIAEVNKAINRHTQWSPILATVVANIPESVVLTTIEVKTKQGSMKIKAPTEDDPKKTKTISVNIPTLKMSVVALMQSNSNEDIRDFRSKLLASDTLGPKLENITVSQRQIKLSSLDVVSHEINCIFKPKQ
jgi:Tfp pilus assembly protein PilN